MTEASLAAGFADELTPEDQAILNGGTPPVPEPKSGDTPAADKAATSADSPPPKQDAKPEAPDLSRPSEDDGEESVEVENKGRFVRHGAFHAERERRKALEKELADFRDKYTRGDERLRLLNEALSAKPPLQQQQPSAPPDPEQDIFGYLKWQSEQINQLSGKLGETGKRVEETTAETQLKTAYVSDVRAFVGTNPDFGDAYQFMLQGRDAELQAMGVADPVERARIITDEEKWIVGRALKANSSPATAIYNMAKARGYKKAEAPLAPSTINEAARAAVVAKTNGDGAAEKIAAITKAKPATQSLSNVGGSPGVDALTMEALASMSEDEYAAIRSKLSPQKFAQIMAG